MNADPLQGGISMSNVTLKSSDQHTLQYEPQHGAKIELAVSEIIENLNMRQALKALGSATVPGIKLSSNSKATLYFNGIPLDMTDTSKTEEVIEEYFRLSELRNQERKAHPDSVEAELERQRLTTYNQELCDSSMQALQALVEQFDGKTPQPTGQLALAVFETLRDVVTAQENKGVKFDSSLFIAHLKSLGYIDNEHYEFKEADFDSLYSRRAYIAGQMINWLGDPVFVRMPYKFAIFIDSHKLHLMTEFRP
jgi:hypothetical protein